MNFINIKTIGLNFIIFENGLVLGKTDIVTLITNNHLKKEGFDIELISYELEHIKYNDYQPYKDIYYTIKIKLNGDSECVFKIWSSKYIKEDDEIIFNNSNDFCF